MTNDYKSFRLLIPNSVRRVMVLLQISAFLLSPVFAGNENARGITEFSGLHSSQQNRKVSGTIKDNATGEALPGVSIVIVGTSSGTVSDANGKYQIDVPVSGEVTLEFSFLGFLSEQIIVGDQQVIDVLLIPDIKQLSEVIVVGYGSVKKSDLTGSVSSVKADDLIARPSHSVDVLLQGQVPGLQVIDYSGEPGSESLLRLRGVTTLAGGSSRPLVVVDGFPVGEAGDLKQINPSDIESIEVLKDASSTAIYGSRGANGVIMITTKKGKTGKSSISFETVQSISSYPKDLDIWRDPYEFAVFSDEERTNVGMGPRYVGRVFAGLYFPSKDELRGYDDSGNQVTKWDQTTDWVDLLYRNPRTQSYTLSARGGDDNTLFSVSGNYYNEEGISIENFYRKYSTKVTLDQKVNKIVSVGANVMLAHTFRDGEGLDVGRNIVFPAYDSLGELTRLGPTDYDNPLSKAYDVLNETKTIDALASAYINLEITSWLSFRSQINYKYGHYITDRYEGREDSYRGFSFNGFGEIYNWDQNYIVNENYFTVHRNLGNIHDVNLVGGFSTEQDVTRWSQLIGQEFSNDNLLNHNMNSATQQILHNNLTRYALQSFYGRVSYSLLDKYLLTFTARADGSSKFGKNNRWGYFPSGAVAWKMHEESFMQSVSAISELKLRASYGISGNQAVAPYQTQDRLGSYKYYVDENGQVGYGPGIFTYDYITKIWTGLPNFDLKWEPTSQFDAGFDLGLFDQRFTLNFDYYYKKTTGLLRQGTLPTSSGSMQLTVNDGVMENKGIEIGANARVHSGRTLQWNVGGTFGLNRNKILDVGDGKKWEWHGNTVEMLRGPVNVYMEGQPVDAFYGYTTDGMIQEGDAGLDYLEYTEPGEIKYLDISGPDGVPDGNLDDFDKKIIGDPTPDFIYSINTSLNYHNFDLSAQFYGVQGNDIVDLRKWSPSNQMKRWTPENPTDEYPRANVNRTYFLSDWFVEDGSFFRLQNVTIGYTYKNEAIKAFNSLRIYFSGSNLLTLTKFHKGFDPEVPSNGQNRVDSGDQYVYGLYPKPRVYAFGINLTF